MLTRRTSLLAGLLLITTPLTVWGNNMDGASGRYMSWLRQFKIDMERLRTLSMNTESLSDEQVGNICKSSIVPNSRASLMVSEWFASSDNKNRSRQRPPQYANLETVVLALLEHSIPAGFGGLFEEAGGSRFPSGRFAVWYMHVEGPETLQNYFADKEKFPKYELPPHGILKRHAYPFLLFEDRTDTLRLAGIGAEWIGAAVYLYQKQYA